MRRYNGPVVAALPLIVSVLALLVPAPSPQGTRESLERLLERQRSARGSQVARLEADARTYLDAFARLSMPLPAGREAELVGQLRGLGPDAGVVLLPYLDPGAEADELARVRAKAVAAALSSMCDTSITDPLLALLRDGSPEGRFNALRALEGCSEPERARPALMALFEADSGALRGAVLRTLVRMGGEGAGAVFARVLESEDVALRRMGLDALVEAQSPIAEAQVRALLGRPSQAGELVERLLDYYRALPAQVDAQVLGLWVALVTRLSRTEQRLAILAALPDLGSDSASALRRELEPLTRGTTPDVLEGARIALARLGDRNARREVLRPHDEFIAKNDRWSGAYLRRAQVLMRMHEWDEAIKDFTTALRFSRDDGRSDPEIYLGLARASARRGKLKDAAEWLRQAPIPMSDLRKLADDPDFRELRASRFGKDVWGE